MQVMLLAFLVMLLTETKTIHIVGVLVDKYVGAIRYKSKEPLILGLLLFSSVGQLYLTKNVIQQDHPLSTRYPHLEISLL